ncbi:unnamed protein product [Chilo suppressalis]|uniref:ZP domain-containing protein n=1 Tax=Chilo suppressalis TaxID=168631 RepID=A0ABN8B264_CHISP|nr:hypothetical protein evm_003176 [Chilo suppressalis]CAH0403088.1 unnamed protein product [Chilo suppressalis]
MARWCAMMALLALMICSSATESQSRFQEVLSSQADSDEMVANLLRWIQGIYQQRNRKARQYFGGKPEKPRPFEPAMYLPPTGYPPAGTRPSPAYSDGLGPSPTIPSLQPSQPSPTPSQPFLPPSSPPEQPPYQPSQPSFSTSNPTYKPSQPTYQPSQPTYQPSQPTYQPSQPTQPTYLPSQPSQPSQPDYQPSQPSQPDYQPSQPTSPPYRPSQPAQPSVTPSYEPIVNTKAPTVVITPPVPVDDDEDRHPPHIHAITVDCGKEMMTINIEFNKPYNGLIYSQDHFSDSSCVYVRENSNQIKFSFTVSLNKCGTRFFSDFQNEGQAYLENVLVLQNEPGIQEVWDHIRRVRCLWEGNLTRQLVSSVSVGMLNQITSNFSGDTAMARLDIQTGRGPFAPEANGLVKIGETMTLVVTVTGDAGFDIFVRECIARDSDSRNVVPLTDSNGCVLKPKLFGAFQKTRDTGNTGASVIAFAYFNAFKFPDEMDLIIQCDVELCKTDCDACPNPGSLEPRRRRRDIIHVGNRTIEPSTTISKGLRVVFAEDLPTPSGFCVSPSAAMWGSILVFLGSLMSSLLVSFCWIRSRGSVKFT